MLSSLHSANKVIYNTGILYIKIFITAIITLYSTRLIIQGLGIQDFGLFNLVNGLIAMLSFFNAAMTVSTQRFFSYYIGQRNKFMLKKVFLNSLILHVFIGFLIILILEVLGFFIFKGFLNIPYNRVNAAQKIYQLMSITVFFTVVSVPFIAAINAHEHMIWIALISIFEVILKLGVTLILFKLNGDRLVAYGAMIAGISFIVFLLYAANALSRYKECSLARSKDYDWKLAKEIGSFAGWNLFGAACGVGRSQGLGIILNLFFGTVINAAYGVANQVSGQLYYFSATMLKALNPQIMKSEGANDRERMLRLSLMASKFGFFLMALIAIPCIFEMPAILSFWLKEVPVFTVMFCNLTLIAIMINQFTIGLQSAFQATGKIKNYQIIVGTTLLFNLPVAYFMLKYGLPVYSVIISYIFFEIIATFLRLFLLKKITGLSISLFFQKVIYKSIIPVISITLTGYFITNYLQINFRFLYTITFSMIIFSISIFFCGLCIDEKRLIYNLIKKKT